MDEDISNLEIEIQVSDPWEIVTEIGERPLIAKTMKTGITTPDSGWDESPAILLKLDKPFKYEGIRFEYLVAAPRHEGDEIDSMFEGKSVFCNIITTSEERVINSNPFDLSWWRGGKQGITGTLKLSRRAGGKSRQEIA